MQRTLVRKDFSVKGRSDIKINNSTNKQINRPRKEKQKKTTKTNKQTNKQNKEKQRKTNKYKTKQKQQIKIQVLSTS
jgi:hypothetical protein